MLTLPDFAKMKKDGDKIAIVTCYDYTSAVILDGTDADALLIGDSLGMTMHGFSSTVPVTMEHMLPAVAAVARGAKNKFLIADMPFASYRKSLSETVSAAAALMQAGAHAVKIEGAEGNLDTIRHLVETGIPVMGHLGLTPQFVNQLGGYKVQGKTHGEALRLRDEARELGQAGAFSLVLECVPAALAEDISQSVSIPTIGIGAGRGVNGQVLVFHDMLGLNTAFKPKFVKRFLNGAKLVTDAIDDYARAVKSKEFPSDENTY